LTVTTMNGAMAKTSLIARSKEEPTGADDDGRHDEDKAGAGVGSMFEQLASAATAAQGQRPGAP